VARPRRADSSELAAAAGVLFVATEPSAHVRAEAKEVIERFLVRNLWVPRIQFARQLAGRF
jgi:hypothetical protein